MKISLMTGRWKYHWWPSVFNEILPHDCQRSRVRLSVSGVVLKPLQKNYVHGWPTGFYGTNRIFLNARLFGVGSVNIKCLPTTVFNHASVVEWSKRSVDPQRIRVRIRTAPDFHCTWPPELSHFLSRIGLLPNWKMLVKRLHTLVYTYCANYQN